MVYMAVFPSLQEGVCASVFFLFLNTHSNFTDLSAVAGGQPGAGASVSASATALQALCSLAASLPKNLLDQELEKVWCYLCKGCRLVLRTSPHPLLQLVRPVLLAVSSGKEAVALPALSTLKVGL